MSVPRSLEELLDQYDRLVYWAILHTSARLRVPLQPDEVDDFRQDVYLRILSKGFLDSSRRYIEAHGGCFSTSLVTLTRRLVLNGLRRRGLRTRRVVSEGTSVDLSRYYHTIPDPIRFEVVFEAADWLDRLGERLNHPGLAWQTSAAFAAALEVGPEPKAIADHLGVPASTVRYRLRLARQMVQQEAW